MVWEKIVEDTINKNQEILLRYLPRGVSLGSLIAVLAVESAGTGLDQLKRPVIRFEVHKMWKYFGKDNPSKFNPHFRFHPRQQWKEHYYRISRNWFALHVGNDQANQQHEWNALYTAMQLDTGTLSYNAALMSASYGAAQIMGFHYRRVGYVSAEHMFRSMFLYEEQIKAFIAFIETDKRLLAALLDKDWASFALYYNGSGQVDKYSRWIATCYSLAIRKLR